MKKTFTLISTMAVTAFCNAQSTVIDFSMVSLIDVDGIYIENDTVYAAEGATGSKIFRILPDGIVQTFVSGLNGPVDITKNIDGNFYITEWGSGSIAKITPTGTKSMFATVPDGPAGITHDMAGNLFITHNINDGAGSITGIDGLGNASTITSDVILSNPLGIDVDMAGNIYVANTNNGKIIKVDTDSAATLLATIPVTGLVKAGYIKIRSGLLYVSAPYGHRVYNVTTTGTVSVLAGTGSAGHVDGDALTSEFSYPKGIAFSSNTANLYVSNGYSDVNYMQVIELDLTSVNSPKQAKTAMVLYPNPANEFISITGNVSEDVFVTIASIDGKVIVKNQYYKTNTLNLNISALQKGFYTCLVQTNNEITSFKFEVL